MMIEFYDQAWNLFSDDAENNGIFSQSVIDIIEKYRNNPVQSVVGEKFDQIGKVVIGYEITSDKIIIKSISDAENIIGERTARADRDKFLEVLERVPDVTSEEGDEIV